MNRIYSLTIFTLCLLLFTSCELEETIDDAFVSDVDVPDTFSIDIPDALSSDIGTLSGRSSGDGDGIIEGNEIYESLRYYIHFGEQAAEIIETSLSIAAVLENSTLLRSINFTGEDGREKRMQLKDNVTKGGVNYAHEFTIIDEVTAQQALQLLWNNNPVEGISILRPFYLDQTAHADIPGVFMRIDYSENSLLYDASMTVSMVGMDPVENGDIDNIKMFVGKKGDVVEVIGNSNHPNLTILDENFTGGRNYAFVGRGNQVSNLGVIKLALPPSGTDRANILSDYSVFNVLESEILSVVDLSDATIDEILAEAQSPAFFNENGFITSGVNNQPVNFDNTFVDLTGMEPFIPNDIKNLSVAFIQ